MSDGTFNLNRGSNYYYSYSNIQFGGRFVLDKTTLNNDGTARLTVKNGGRIMLIGVDFDYNTGNITDWLKEEYSK